MAGSDRPVRVKTGCCGFRTSLRQYVSSFPVIEVQQTFYQPPRVETLRRWRGDSPPDFEFTVKAWQLITHESKSPTYRRLKRELSAAEREGCGAFRPTPIVREAFDVTIASAEALKASRILFQCPASFNPSDEHVDNIHDFFTKTAAGTGFKYMWEPRGHWPPDLVRVLCRELKLIHVVDPFSAKTVTPRSCYFRLHGRTGFRYVYEDSELEELLGMLPRGSTSYVLFNNVHMVKDAARFQDLVASRK